MLDFRSFSNRDKQHLLQMLKMSSNNGVVSVTDLQKILENQILNIGEIHTPKKSKSKYLPSPVRCPDCGSKNYHSGKDVFEGVTTRFMWCKSCTYSEEIK